MATIKNIIFDLGGVLLDIDTGRTNEAFAKLGVTGFQNQYTLQKADSLFDELEKGHIEEAAFYEAIRRKAGLQLPDQEIRDAWNALILEFRTESIERLASLKEQYNIYLLSNTNRIHYDAFQQQFREKFGNRFFDDCFTRAWYSHQVGMRKPDAQLFEYALASAGILAGETIFIDDLPKNTDAAARLGIKTHLLLPGERIENLGW